MSCKALFYLAFCSLGLLMAACERVDNMYPKTKEEMLRPHTWIITDLVKGPPGGASVSVLNSLPPCERDNEYRFRSEGRFYLNTGVLQCDSSEKKDYQGSWALRNEVMLEMYSAYDTVTLIVQELSESNLRAYYDEVIGTTPSRYTFIFSVK